ncbi:MAG: DUF2236 domain-containing protein [Chloroflexota bacterium]|nr:DUF2236 domain-containing protein [Chloroflexota bacterium]
MKRTAQADPQRDASRSRQVAAGLAGPGSVSGKINAEVATLLGWGPAIVMQFAHPLVAAGVADHSAFARSTRARPGRLHGTVRAMLALTFGTRDEALRAAAGINTIHDYVHGRLSAAAGIFPAGTPYSAHDPELLRWVQATLLDCLPRAYKLFVEPLTEAEQDRYCQEASGAGSLLGIPEDFLPADSTELRAYMAAMLASGQIAVTPAARALSWELMNPFYPRLLWPLYWPLKLATIGLLTPEIRTAYGYPWSRREERALRAFGWLVRHTVPVLPSPLRHWPASRRTHLILHTETG